MKNWMEERFQTAAGAWLDSMQENISPSTYYRYENIIEKHLQTFFQDMQMKEITADKIKVLIANKQEEGLGESTLRILILVLKNILKFSGNTAEAGMKIKSELHVDLPKDETQTMEDEHAEILEQYLLANPDENSLTVLFSLKMGLQLGEICGLRWCDVDMKNRIISIRHVVQRFPAKDGKKKTELVLIEPSGEAQERSIPIPDSVMEQLKKIRNKKYSKAGRILDKEEQDLLFVVTGKTKLPDPRTMQYRFRKILEKLELPEYKFTALRHTFAFHCVEIGMDMKLLSKLMGHSSMATTATRYVVERKESQKEQIERFIAG